MINTAFASEVSEVSQSAPNGFQSFLPLVLIFIIFYIFIIRPQTKKQKEQQNLINNVKKGDKVILTSGIIGKIIKISDSEVFEVEISKGVSIQALKSTITSLASELDKKKK